ncbi:MAG: flagellar motor protein MotB [Gammaproteobacteria bacterium]|nr:flagellar motor protein MotB [Gammaproteobacteria bacterium]MDX2458694.1 flagellar motor protein MotB [Gammaproteobacteria bacterium]
MKSPQLTACLIILATSFVLAGCVSKEKYEALEQENAGLRTENMKLTEASLFLSGELLEADREVLMLEQQQEALSDEVARWAAAGAVKMELLASGLQIILPNEVLFTTGSANLKPEGQDLLKELIEALEDVPYQIVVIGHTDNVPIGPGLAKRYPSNWELAGARASSVVRVMASEGIPPQQLLAISMGDTRPLVANDTEEGRKRNRRIEVRLRPVIIQ